MIKTHRAGFRRGLEHGFSSPYGALFGQRFKASKKPTNLIYVSWERVGRAMSAAIEREGKSIGEAARTEQAKQR